MVQRQPMAVLLRAGHALRDEIHAIDAVGYVRVKALGAVDLVAAGPGHHVGVGGRVNVRKGLEKRFRMAAGQPAVSVISARTLTT